MYSKEQVTPHNTPPVEVCPMADSGLSSSPLYSTMNQVAGLHHYFQSEQYHILCGNPPDSENSMKQISENNQGPHKICWSGKNLLQCLPICSPYTDSRMSWSVLFRLPTNILSIRKATNQEQRSCPYLHLQWTWELKQTNYNLLSNQLRKWEKRLYTYSHQHNLYVKPRNPTTMLLITL